MSDYFEQDAGKVSRPPLVVDTTHPDETDDTTPGGSAGALVALDGPPVDGGVPTYDSGTGKHTSQVPAGGGMSDGDKGDITVGGTGTTLTIDNDAVTYAKMQDVSAASKLLGRGSAGGSGNVEEIALGTGLVMSGTTLNASASIAGFGAAGPKTDPDDAGGGWGWENQGSATVTVSGRDGSIHLASPADATNTYRARTKNAPATPWTAIVNLEMPYLNFDFLGYGMMVGNGSEARAIYIAAVSGAVNLYIAPTTGRAFGSTYVGPFVMTDRPKFLAIHDNGTNNTFYIGAEEENMLPIFSQSRTNDGITASKVGFFVAPRNGTIPAKLTVFSWKEQSAAPG